MFDSLTVSMFFGSAEMAAIFGDTGLLQAWLDTEAALARGQASLGIIPAEAATTITAAARVVALDLSALRQDMASTTHPLVPLIRALVRGAGEPAGGYVHLGSTTQDIMDTGYVLCARRALAVLGRHMATLATILRRHAAAHRSTVTTGRTHGQQALPTSFGLRVAGWLDEFDRHRRRLADLRPRLLVGSFGGAVGTMAGYGPRAIELRAAVMAELGLGVPRTSWHASQDGFAECIAVLGMIASSAEKLAREVYFLGRTEIGEVFEPQGADQVGSSTMPHKQNPILCEAITGAAITLRAQVPVALAAMVAQDDRDMGPGISLWKLIPDSFILAGGILERLITVFDGLRIDPRRMRQNLELTGGLILSEAVMLRLAERVGREDAHHAVSEAARLCVSGGRPFIDCLAAHPAIGGRLAIGELAALLAPDDYIGVAATLVDQVLRDLPP